MYIFWEFWDDFFRVLLFFTEWEEFIIEWFNIMDFLIVVFARIVYGVEMINLFLDKLSE